MTAKHVLREALAVIERDHAAPPPFQTFLAVDEHGEPVRPVDATAVAWTSVGAVCRVAPALSASDPQVWADHISVAFEAAGLLDQAALLQGYPDTTSVDRAGREAAMRMFWCAINFADPEPRRRLRSATGTGSSPRGEVA